MLWNVAGAVLLERLTYYGIASNLVSYLTIKLHEGSGDAVTNVWIWGGVAWLVPLLGGFIADSFLGRYRTITYSLFIYVVVSFATNCPLCKSYGTVLYKFLPGIWYLGLSRSRWLPGMSELVQISLVFEEFLLIEFILCFNCRVWSS